MASYINFLGAILVFVSLIHGGSSDCTNADLKLDQAPTGGNVGGKPEFKFTLTNTCDCVFVDIILACDGFQTQEPINQSTLKQDGGDCTINGGNPITPNSALSFNYAWDKSFDFILKSAQIACS